MDDIGALQMQLERQLAHWTTAMITLRDADNFASPSAWRSLESYVGTAIRRPLQAAVDRIDSELTGLKAQLACARELPHLEEVRRRLLLFRTRFARTEMVLDFYGDAVNTRTGAKLASIARGCDIIAEQTMRAVLGPLGRPVPPVLTYVDKGMGASILRAGLRLWDGGSISPAAAIKITRQNLYRPTSLVHETGHQVAGILGWDPELAEVFRRELGKDSMVAAEAWASWTSEVSADTFGFVHTGYGSVAALHDVVANDEANVLRFIPGDPHPIAYLRVLLGVEMCIRCFGAGPWDALSAAWRRVNAIERSEPRVRSLIEASLPLLPKLAQLCLARPLRALGGRSISDLVDPARVRPDRLLTMIRDTGNELYTAHGRLAADPALTLAVSSYRMATEPARAAELAQQYEEWMGVLGHPLRKSA